MCEVQDCPSEAGLQGLPASLCDLLIYGLQHCRLQARKELWLVGRTQKES